MDIQPYQQRVVEERDELDSRLGKLFEFVVNNPIFKKLPNDEQVRLKKQGFAMSVYLEILNERIAAFEISSDEGIPAPSETGTPG